MNSAKRQAFTLMELLVTLGIIAGVSVVAVVALNPAELLKQSRDEKRISEVSLLSKTLELYVSVADGATLGTASTSYISIPDPTATSTLGNQCQSLGLPPLPWGWVYHCAAPAYYRNIDGSGWLPVNLTQMPSGSPLSQLPVDPQAATSTGRYFTYATDGVLGYELTATVESRKFGQGGAADVVSRDAGEYPDLYEVGRVTTLAPINHSGGGAVQSAYTFSGFLPPIEQGGTGIYNLGRTLPIKFQLTDSQGNSITTPVVHLAVTKVQNGIVGTNPVVLATSTNDSGDLFQVAGQQYKYNLDTGQLTEGTWQLKAVVDDRSTYTELISLDD